MTTYMPEASLNVTYFKSVPLLPGATIKQAFQQTSSIPFSVSGTVLSLGSGTESGVEKANFSAPTPQNNSSEYMPMKLLKDFVKAYIAVGAFCLVGTAVAMGSGSGGGGGGSSSPLFREVGSSAFKPYNEGVDLMHAKKFDRAQVKFEQAIRANPNFAEAHNNLGFVLRQQSAQNYSKALQHYNKAIQLKPNLAEAYEYRGVLFAKIGRSADAQKDLATLKKLNAKLDGELESYLKTGKEEEESAGTSPKHSQLDY